MFVGLVWILAGGPSPEAARAALQHESAAENQKDRPRMDLVLRPVVNAASQVTDVEVSTTIRLGVEPANAPFTLKIPVVFGGVRGIADGVKDLVVGGESGAVRLDQTDDAPDASGFVYYRRWQAAQPIRGTIAAKYRYHLATPHPNPGPPFDLRPNGGGVSGAGAGFLLLPDDKRVFDVHLSWDLGNMKAGSQGASSLGNGDVQVQVPMEALLASFFMAGPLKRYPADGGADGFSAAWIGTPPFNAEEVMARSAKAYSALCSFFQDSNPPPFRVFMREGPDNVSEGGAALTNSFMLFLPTDANLTRNVDGVIAHEMVHHFVGSLEGTPGLISWYGEGLAEYYSRVQMFRVGLLSIPQFLDMINRKAVQYYTNPLINLPNDQVPKYFWTTRNAQIVPYDRGFFYFVDVNAKLRTVTKGKVSLDDLVLSMIDRQRHGKEPTQQTWLETVEAVLGASALKEFESVMVEGHTLVADSEAFGRCFERRPVELRTFEVGFDERASLYIPPRLIHGLIKGSAAEAAGLRNDDEVLEPVDLDALRSNPDMKAKLKIRRGKKVMEIEYLPRGKKVQGYEWVRIPHVTDAQCRIM